MTVGGVVRAPGGVCLQLMVDKLEEFPGLEGLRVDS